MRTSVIALVPVSAVVRQPFGVFLSVAVCFWLVRPSAAAAQPRCGDPDPEISISLCSAVIQSGRVRGRDLAVAHTERGVAFVTLLDYDRALQDFDEAIRADPKLARAFANRGAVRGARQDFDRAIEDFSQVVKLAPSPSAFADRAGMYRLNGQHEEAIRDYDEAIRLNPAFEEALLNRAITLAGTSRCAAAIPDFTRVLELNPKQALALVDRAVCHEAAGRDDLALDSRSQEGLERRAALHFRARRYDRALADYAQALIVNPSSATALYGRGVLKRLAGDIRGGDQDIEMAKAMRPRVAEQSAARGVKP
jgi:tetratricopeptide (TPR) repeat protein